MQLENRVRNAFEWGAANFSMVPSEDIAKTFCCAVIVETVLSTFVELGKLAKLKSEEGLQSSSGRTLALCKHNISANLGAAAFFGLSMGGFLPHAQKVATALGILYSICTCDDKDAYILARMVGKPIKKAVVLGADYALFPAFDHIVKPAFEHVIIPIGNGLVQVCSTLLNGLSLPKHPIWYGVATLAVAAYVYNRKSL